jgi:hypothetical protein
LSILAPHITYTMCISTLEYNFSRWDKVWTGTVDAPRGRIQGWDCLITPSLPKQFITSFNNAMQLKSDGVLQWLFYFYKKQFKEVHPFGFYCISVIKFFKICLGSRLIPLTPSSHCVLLCPSHPHPLCVYLLQSKV